MNWVSWSDFAAMGGYGLYVWGSFAMCALVLSIELGLLAARRRAASRPDDLGGLDNGEVGARKPRSKRALAVAVALVALGVASALVLQAFQSNLVFFFSPSQIMANEAPRERSFRVGGLVEQGSIERDTQGLTIRFKVTDTAHAIPVTYTGLLPDLFKEGKGVVAEGKLGTDGVFRANQVLAKHDENYMPPEAAEAIKNAASHKEQSTATLAMPPAKGSPAMIYELGHVALILALAMALAQSVLPLVGAQTGNAAWIGLARPSARGQFLFMLLAYASLTYAFVNNDFTVALAANHSNSTLPLHYRITAVWGNHEGSILLWSLILSGWTLAVSLFSRQLDERMVARVLGVMGLISCGFILFTLLTSNPFERMFPPPADGRDLNPLLQDPGMVIHPPMLYMGYVGFVVAFAFAVSALLSGRLDAAWARWSRPWTTVAWCFLTCGIALGSFWAYYELGWGGWWFWDPVENASFMPWLVGTALIHSLAVTEKRGGFKMWTALLAIMAFSLSLLGTFIVRSGVLSSVHAFATDPARGIFILGFLALVIGGSLALFAWRAPRVGLGGSFEPISRESMLLANNVLLLVAAAAVLLGTLYPLVIDALGMGKLSVGPPYFDTVFVPLMTPALFLMGVGPLARWRQASLPDLAYRLRWAFGVSVASAIVAFFALGKWTPMIGLGLALAAWIASTAVLALVTRLRENRSDNWIRRLAAQPGSFYGMVLAHFGVAVFVVGVTVVSGFQSENDVRMEPGDTANVAGYQVRLDKVEDFRGPNYEASRATLTITQDGKRVATVTPDRRVYNVSRQPMTEVAIDRGLLRDVYIALGDPVSATAWSVRLHHKPFVNWIWIGCVLMALGGFLAVLDRRYRKVRVHASQRNRPSDTGARAPVDAVGAARTGHAHP